MPLFLLGPIATLGFPALVSLDEFCEVARLLRHPHELVLQQVFSRGPLVANTQYIVVEYVFHEHVRRVGLVGGSMRQNL